jgi:carboxylesterase type B
VKTGDPNGGSLPKWPAYTPARDMLMNFTNDGPVPEADPLKARLDLAEKLAVKPAAPSAAISNAAKTGTK